MRRSLLTALFVAAIGCSAGCATSEPSVQPITMGRPLETASNERSSLPALDDPRPLLTMASWPYLEDGPSRPHDLPFYVVYASGEVLTFALPGVPRRRVASDGELSELLRVADAAGLTGGGMQPFLAEDPPQTIDGGQGVFTARAGGTITSRVVDQPSSGGSPERERFVDLFEQLVEIGLTEPTEPIVLDDWAITRRHLDPTADGESNRTTWTGPALADLDWELLDGVECVVVRDLDWPYGADELADARYIADGMVTTRRPLLPHETGCSDVVEFRAVLGL